MKTMKSIQIFKALSLVFTILMTACSKSEVARRNNEGAKTVEVVHSAQETTELAKQLAALNLTQIYEESVKQNDPKALLILINQLAGFVLNKEFVEDPSIRSGQIMRTLLGNFNEAFLRVKKLVPSSAETQVILEKYLDIAFAGCDSKSLKNCKNYNFFRTDFRSIDILMFKVKQLDAELVKGLRAQECKDVCSKNIAQYYRILNLISDEKNPEKRSEIEFAYLKFSREYAKHITAATPKGEVPPLSVREELAAHASYFESLISKFNGDPKSAGFKEFVLNFKPWSYSRLEIDLFPYGTEKMFKYSAQNYLYINNEQGARALNPDLAQAILDSQAIGKEDKSGQNFSDSIRDLKSEIQNCSKHLALMQI